MLRTAEAKGAPGKKIAGAHWRAHVRREAAQRGAVEQGSGARYRAGAVTLDGIDAKNGVALKFAAQRDDEGENDTHWRPGEREHPIAAPKRNAAADGQRQRDKANDQQRLAAQRAPQSFEEPRQGSLIDAESNGG